MGHTEEDGTVVSRDAQHSSYEAAPVDEEQNPPGGGGSVQTLAAPAEAAPQMAKKTPAKSEA